MNSCALTASVTALANAIACKLDNDEPALLSSVQSGLFTVCIFSWKTPPFQAKKCNCLPQQKGRRPRNSGPPEISAFCGTGGGLTLFLQRLVQDHVLDLH